MPLLTLVLLAGQAFAICNGSFLNPVTEVAWRGMFPIRIGGVKLVDSGEPDTSDSLTSAVCSCPGPAGIQIPGVSVSFWEPVGIIESVHDPFCFPSLGINANSAVTPGHLAGTHTGRSPKKTNPHFFAQAHFIRFPVLKLLDLLVDISCINGSMTISPAYLTETDPMWQDDIKNLLFNPEALLFANPVMQMSCIPDAVAAASDMPRKELFWCMGQWGSAYPLSGSIMAHNPLIGYAGTAARLLFKVLKISAVAGFVPGGQGNAPEIILCDQAINSCGCTPTPIWVKSHYRFQIIRPKLDTGHILRIGEPSPIWEANQAPPLKKGVDNFAFLVFRKLNCCIIYLPSI